MSHPICYLIDLGGEDFNALMDRRHQATHEYIEGIRNQREVGTWDGMLPNSPMIFTVDLAGSWTLCTIPHSYSHLLAEQKDTPIHSEIAEWEKCLRKVLPHQTLIRFDDLLLDQCNVEYDYLMTRYPEAIHKFIAWLLSQDPLYWSKVPVEP